MGTLSVPLRPLLRQGQPATDVLLRVPVGDPAEGVQRLDGGGCAVRLTTAPLRGSTLLRLACTGRRLAAAGPGSGAGACGWLASPLKQQAGAAAVVVTARPALEEGGHLARELARQEGVRRALA